MKRTSKMTVSFMLLAIPFLISFMGGTGRAWMAGGSPICVEVGNQFHIDMCPDGAGGAYIAWVDARTGDGNVYIQHVDGDGMPLFEMNGMCICNASMEQFRIDICPDGFGGAIVAWQDFRNGVDYDIFAQRVLPTGDIAWVENGTNVVTTANNQEWPKVCMDGTGGAYFTWLHRTGNPTSETDVFACRIDETGARITNDTLGTPICTLTGYQYRPKIEFDEFGSAIIGWDGNNVIYGQKINATSETEWTADGVIICNEAQFRSDVELVADHSGGVYFLWKDSRNGDDDIYGQRMLSNGIPAWIPNGTVICNAGDDQSSVKATHDGAGGVILAWQDLRGGTVNETIYTQRVHDNGTGAWPVNGLPVCLTDESKGGISICPDGTGGVGITWYAYTDNEGDIWAQRLDAHGIPFYEPDGRMVCGEPGEQTEPVITNVAPKSFIIAWEDHRGDIDGDVYAAGIINQVPTASISSDPANPGVGDIVRFTSTGSTGDGNPIFQWSFGDASANSTLQAPEHTYQAAGNYTVSLTVTDEDGDTAFAQITLEVTSGGGKIPGINITWMLGALIASIGIISVLIRKNT